MLSRMSSENTNKSTQKASTFRRARAETLPACAGGNNLSFKTLRGNAASNSSLNSGLTTSTNTPFRSRLSSFTLNGLDASMSFSKLSWDDSVSFHTLNSHADLSSASILSHYDAAAAKTLDFLGLNDDNSPLHARSNSSDFTKSNGPFLKNENSPYGAYHPISAVENINDSDSEHTDNSPHSAPSVHSDDLNHDIESLCLKIENLSVDTTLSKLTNEVSQYGDVESVQLVKKEGTGYVTFSTANEAKLAHDSLNDANFLNSIIKVKFYREASSTERNFYGKGSSQVSLNSQGSKQGDVHDLSAKASSSDASQNNYKKTKDYYTRQFESFKLSSAEALARGSPKNENLLAFDYAITLPPIPNPNFKRKVEPTRLRELRKQLDADPSPDVISATFNESKDCWVDLCSDYIGNIIIQKLIEYGTEQQKTSLIHSIAPHMAAIGIHKNGTWAIQKMIECANTEEQIISIAASLKSFTPALLLDQFGNYVVQCCLKFDYPHNQFIFDSIYARCSEIAQGRYGARAIRTCLDSQYTIPSQKDLVSEALMRNAFPLSTNANGSLLLNWILDSQHTEHYLGIAVNLNPRLAQLCCHKLASSLILRLINQQHELQSRDFLIYRIFFQGSPGLLLTEIITDPNQGNQFIHKILNSPYLGEDLRSAIQIAVSTYAPSIDSQQLLSYRRLFDDVPSYNSVHLSHQVPVLDGGFTYGTQPLSDMGNNGPWSWNWGGPSMANTSLYSSQHTSSSNLQVGSSYFVPASGSLSYPSTTYNNNDQRSRQNSSHIVLNSN